MFKSKVIIGSIVGGLASALSVMALAWNHNAQCEIHCEGQIYWGYWLSLGASGFLPVFLFAMLIFGLINRGEKHITKRSI